VNLDTVPEAIHSGQPAPAALAALVAFHALRSSQLASLGLSDVRDGHLHLDGRIIPLAGLIRDRLTAWLAERARIPADLFGNRCTTNSLEASAELPDLDACPAVRERSLMPMSGSLSGQGCSQRGGTFAQLA